MAASKVISIKQAQRTRADRFLGLDQSLPEDASQSGLPEFKNLPKLRSRYTKLPERLKEQPANTAHFVALAQIVFETMVKIVAEIEQLKKTVRKR